MKKRPSSIDVARLAEVSQATVSYVLRGRADKSISEDTRERVLKAASDLGYRPNRLADGVLRGRTSTIGVLMPDFAHSFNAKLLMGLEEAFGQKGYRILIAHSGNSPTREKEQVEMLMEQRVDGLIVATDENTVDDMPKWVADVSRTGVPVCVVDDSRLAGIVDTVVTDDVHGASLATSHLIAQGHTRIGYLGGGERASSSRDRKEGYRRALDAHGIPFDEALVVGTGYWVEQDPDLRPILSVKNPPTALFAASDGLACQALARLQEEGESIPDGFAVVGYGNLEWARYTGLSSISQAPEMMGRNAAELLMRRLAGESGAPTTERLPVELIVRRSSCPVTLK